MTFPAMLAFLARWAPPEERSRSGLIIASAIRKQRAERHKRRKENRQKGENTEGQNTEKTKILKHHTQDSEGI